MRAHTGSSAKIRARRGCSACTSKPVRNDCDQRASNQIRDCPLRPKAKLLLVVWGERYIDRFSELALPCLLAPGNLPALASGCELEFIVLTSEVGADYFRRHRSLQRLPGICPLRFIAIDDLISEGVYGVTLTLAFTRGIADCGDAMLETHFIFLNSDFMLADGSLATLLNRIRAGHRCILAPSFRAIAEEVEPMFRELALSGGGVIAMPPRQMVGIALKHLHATTVAKTVNQTLLQTMHPNQFYWRVDPDTMLGRFFLIFMLCIQPERRFTAATSFCDYGFVPEMCPSGRFSVIADSDDFFMLEAQGRLQESSHLCLGPQSRQSVISNLREWTTREHRLVADHDLVFHSSDLPPGMEKWKESAGRFVDSVKADLPPPPSHSLHPYWIAGVATWKERQAQRGSQSVPKEIAGHTGTSGSLPGPIGGTASADTPISAGGWRGAIHRLLVGKRPYLRIWHHEWADYHMLRGAIGEFFSGVDKVLAIGARETPVSAFFSSHEGKMTFMEYSELASARVSESVKFGAVICVVTPRELRWPGPRLLESLLPMLRQGGRLCVVLHNAGDDFFRRDIRKELVRFAAQVPRDGLAHVASRYCGGSAKQILRASLGLAAIVFARHGVLATALATPVLTLLLVVSLLNNLYLSFLRDQSRYLDGCTSLVLNFERT